jgi:hypothetical protein
MKIAPNLPILASENSNNLKDFFKSYFYYGRTWYIATEDKFHVREVIQKQPFWVIALKVVSFVTGVFPLIALFFLFKTLVNRFGKDFIKVEEIELKQKVQEPLPEPKPEKIYPKKSKEEVDAINAWYRLQQLRISKEKLRSLSILGNFKWLEKGIAFGGTKNDILKQCFLIHHWIASDDIDRFQRGVDLFHQFLDQGTDEQVKEALQNIILGPVEEIIPVLEHLLRELKA